MDTGRMILQNMRRVKQAVNLQFKDFKDESRKILIEISSILYITKKTSRCILFSYDPNLDNFCWAKEGPG